MNQRNRLRRAYYNTAAQSGAAHRKGRMMKKFVVVHFVPDERGGVSYVAKFFVTLEDARAFAKKCGGSPIIFPLSAAVW